MVPGIDIDGITVSPNLGAIATDVGNAVGSSLPDTTLSGTISDITGIDPSTQAAISQTVAVAPTPAAVPAAPQTAKPTTATTKALGGGVLLAGIGVAAYLLHRKG